jgi:hypothetical protein
MILYAKVNQNLLVQFPYSWQDLYLENPNTTYDSRYSLPEWYALTEQAASTGNTVVEVSGSHVAPPYNSLTEKVVEATSPSLYNGVWLFLSTIIPKTQAEIDADAMQSVQIPQSTVLGSV